MSATVSLSGRADWLGEKHLQRLLAVLADGGEAARVAGGAVRTVVDKVFATGRDESEWVADEMAPATLDQLGLFLRSAEHGVYVNVRAQGASVHPLTTEGLLQLLREQNWASVPFDEWVTTSRGLIVVGGTFETVGMGGEVVLEVFVTDGRSVANLAGPGERAVIAAVTPSVQRLASTLRFE